MNIATCARNARPSWKATSERRYRDGDRVRHARWGDGIVINSKLRRGEQFQFTWKDDSSIGDGRTTIWVHPHCSIAYKFYGSRKPAIAASTEPTTAAGSISARRSTRLRVSRSRVAITVQPVRWVQAQIHPRAPYGDTYTAVPRATQW